MDVYGLVLAGGRWSKFKSYSTFQRTLEIWGFVLKFAWRYVLLNQKWTYKKAGGMTKENVSQVRQQQTQPTFVIVLVFVLLIGLFSQQLAASAAPFHTAAVALHLANANVTYPQLIHLLTPAPLLARPQRKSELAVWLREELVKLGPTFIKVGQQFSTRVDVLAPEFVKELEKLQDSVPAFEWETAQVRRSGQGRLGRGRGRGRWG